jgi:predicted nuclease of predicted toxin-antitoxin system
MDRDLLDHAFKNDQVILTKDKDFGELVFRDQLLTKGVILIRLENVITNQRVELCLEWFIRLDWDFDLKYTTITQSLARVIDLA